MRQMQLDDTIRGIFGNIQIQNHPSIVDNSGISDITAT